MIRNECRHDVVLAGFARDNAQRPRNLAIQLRQLRLHLRRRRSVRVADVVGSFEIHQNQIGHLIGADRLAFQHCRERATLEPLKYRRVSELRRIRNVVPHPIAVQLFPGLAGVERFQGGGRTLPAWRGHRSNIGGRAAGVSRLRC